MPEIVLFSLFLNILVNKHHEMEILYGDTDVDKDAGVK